MKRPRKKSQYSPPISHEEERLNVIKELHEIVVHIRGSNTRLLEFEKICTLNKKKNKRIPLDTPLRWSSTYKMLHVCLKYKKEIQSYCAQQDIAKITKSNWQKLSLLKGILKDFAIATDTCQAEKNPTIFLSIPIFNQLFDALDELIEKKSFVHAALRARRKLKDYYKLTDDCSCHYISAILNPCTKLEYFKNNDWDQETLKEIEKLFDFCFYLIK